MARMDDVVTLLYETVETPALWAEAVAALTGAMGATKGAMFSALPGPPGGFATSGYPNEQIAAYRCRYHLLDVWAEAAVRKATEPGRPYLSDELVLEADLRRSDFYTEYLRRFGDYHGCGVNFRGPEGAMTVLNFVREERRGRFDAVPVETLRRAAPHVARALRLRGLLADARNGTRRLQGALDALTLPLFVVDRRRRVVEANRAADRLLARSAALRCRTGVLRTADARADRVLAARVVDAVAVAGGRAGGPCGGAFTVETDEDERLDIIVSPWRTRRHRHQAPDALALVGVTPHGGTLQSPRARGHLMELYGLTPSEANVLEAVVRGRSVEEMTDALGLTASTVRSYLKSLHGKLECRSRSELVAHALQSASWWLD